MKQAISFIGTLNYKTEMITMGTPRQKHLWVLEIVFGVILPCFLLAFEYSLARIESGFGLIPTGFSQISPAVIYGAAFPTMAMVLLKPVSNTTFQSFRAGWLVFGALISLWLGIMIVSVLFMLRGIGTALSILILPNFIACLIYVRSANTQHWWNRHRTWVMSGFLLPALCFGALEMGERIWIRPLEVALTEAKIPPEQAISAITALGRYPFKFFRHVRPICNYLLGPRFDPSTEISKRVVAAAQGALNVTQPVAFCENADN